MAKKTASVDDIFGVGKAGSSFFEGEVIPTGILALDSQIGGGIPRGKIVEAYGQPAAGKSSVAMMLAGQAQKFGKVVYFDLEDTLDPRLLENSGVDMDELLLGGEGVPAEEVTAEWVFDTLHEIARVDDVSLVIVDSVAAMVPAAEMAGTMEDSHMALMGRKMSEGLRKLVAINKGPDAPIFFFVNQVRGTIPKGGYGPTTESTGGRALRFYSSIRFDVSRFQGVKEGSSESSQIVGHEVKVTVVKNKFHPQGKIAKYKILYDHGVSNEITVMNEALAAGFLTKSGSWYKVAGEEKNAANGELAMAAYLRDNPDVMADLMEKMEV